MMRVSLEEAAMIESVTAKGLKLEYMMNGEKIIPMMNQYPIGPTIGLYHAFFPNSFCLRISA